MKAFQRRKTIKDTLRNTAIAAGIMLLLFVGAGVIYVYITGKSGAEKLANTPEEEKSEPVKRPEPLEPGPDSPVSASVVFISSPVHPGENATMSVHTRSKATCTIVAAYKDVISKDSGLIEKVADIHGSVSWTWTVDKTAAPGKWPMKATCKYNDKTGYVEGTLEVIK